MAKTTSGWILIFIFSIVFTACDDRKDSSENELSPQEENQIFHMAKSYFQPLPELDWTIYTEADKSQILLGKKLFFDKKLSKNKTQNCASCHDMNRFGQDNLRVSPGDGGVLGVRNVPSIFNAHLQFAQFWDAREQSVEEQAAGPIFGDVEMGMTDTIELLNRLIADSSYQTLFSKAFPATDTLFNLEHIKTAIGAFERTLLTPSRFDEYLRGEKSVLTVSEKKGIKRFIDQGCIPCHSGVLLGGNMIQEFAIFGYYWDYTNSKHLDKGVYEHSFREKDMFVFKVPGLRNVAETGPYFHDGSVESLEESINIMGHAELNADIAEEDVQYMVAFLKSLTGQVPDYAFEENSFPSSQ